MTGGGPVQELEQQRPWPPGAGESRRPWSRTGRLEMNHPSESPYFHNNTTGINVGQRITFNGGRDETTTTTATHSHNHMTTSNLIKSSSAAKTFDNFQHNSYNSKQSEEANYFQRAKTNNDNFCDFNSSTSIRPETPNEIRSLTNLNKLNGVCEREDFNLDEDDEDDDESLSEPLSAVASAEEYAAKIFKLQQACLTPLKEDLADWLNKIMDLSSITSENFMHKLDNGVIICRLAKIISMWCEQQFSNQQLINSSHQELTGIPQYPVISEKHHQKSPIIIQPSDEYSRTATATIVTQAQNYPQKLSTSTSNVYSHLNKNNPTSNVESYDNLKGTSTATTPLTPVLRPQPRARVFTSHGGQLKSTSLSTNCIASLSSANSLSYLSSTNPFLDNLIKMIQTKIWEDAKCRTFYARDNVSNFLRWTRGFGVNQSVLFESDDLVLHANTRQVVLCLLDVARIACVKHGFTEAPGLVKFEQEIDRELAAEREAAENGGRDDAQFSHSVASSGGRFVSQNNNHTTKRLSSRDESATDELILRYCRHKEEEAARKKAAAEVLKEEENESSQERDVAMFEPDSLAGGSPDDKDSGTSTTKSPTGDPHSRNNHIGYDYRVDSLDSGEGRTESASTSHSRTPVNSLPQTKTQSAIPVPVKQQQQQQQQRQRSQSNSSLSRASSITTSELSSSRSSLLSNQDSCVTGNKRHTASSDLDGKVMRIAKSYYGKGAKRDVTRLSEGKYKIADRIVFVRLLKGHRVMVRIGGGWDTLENFLFRHKSDPSQVIDVDNLLPLETKMTFEKSSSSHANSSANGLHKQNSRLPYYQQQKSSSASSTNLSTSIDLSVVSPAMSSIEGSITTAASSASTSQAICTPVRRINNIPPNRQESMPESSSATTNTPHQTPYLLIHRGNNRQQRQNSFPSKHPVIPHRANSTQASLPSKIQAKNTPLRKLSGAHIGNRPLGNSRTPNASSTNLYPATLTTNRIAQSASSSKPFNNNSSRLLNGSSNNLLNGTNHNGGNHQDRLNQKQEAFRKLGRSSDSLQQVSYLRSPRNYGNLTTTSNNGSRNNAINNGPPKLTPNVSAKEAKA